MYVSSSELSQGIVGKYLIDIDVNLLLQAPISEVNENDNREANGGILLFPSNETLIADKLINLVPERKGQYVKGVDTLSGSLLGDESGSFTLSVSDNHVFGNVTLDYKFIDIRFNQELHSHVLSVTDQQLIPKDTNEPDYTDVGSSGGISIENFSPSSNVSDGLDLSLLSSGSNGNIRLFVFYTQKVENRNDINALAANIVSEFNTTLDQSDVDPDIVFTLAGTKQMYSNVDGLCRTALRTKLTHSNFPFQDYKQVLGQEYADVALFIVTTEPTYTNCFYAGRVGGVAGAIFSSSQPAAITTDTYALGDLTAIHEIGHVLGGQHEIEDGNQTDPDTPVFSRGYVGSDETWQTIMGGYIGCEFEPLPNPPDCVRIPKWSNPNKIYEGEYTGVTNESDMESALEITAPVVADWTSYPTAAPTQVPVLTVTSDHCYGANSVNWSSISGAEFYQLFMSYSSLFVGSNKIYIGGGSFLRYRVGPFETKYLRVQACNGNGCGPFSNIGTATYYNGCL